MKHIYIIITIIFLSYNINAQSKLTLEEALTMGLENNYSLKISKLSTKQAELKNTYGMAGGLPTVKLNAMGNINEEIKKSTTTMMGQVGADVAWTLFDGFSIKTTKAQLENSLFLSKGKEMVQIETTIESIINSYYYVLLQQKMLEISKTILDISADRFSQQKTSREIGASGNYEYILAETDYLNDKSSFMNQEIVYRNAVRSLNILLVAPLDTTWMLVNNFESPKENYQLSTMIDKMLENNTNIKNQYLNTITKELEIKKMRSELYPSIGINASFDVGINKVEKVKSEFYRPEVGFNMSYTLFNGTKARRNVEIAELGKEIADVEFEDMKVKIQQQLLSEYERYLMYRDLEKLEAQKLKATELLMSVSKEKYKIGAINSFNFREVQLSYLRSATSQLNASLELIFANTSLLRLTGGILGTEK